MKAETVNMWADRDVKTCYLLEERDQEHGWEDTGNRFPYLKTATDACNHYNATGGTHIYRVVRRTITREVVRP